MKRIILISLFFAIALMACPQKLEQTFDELILVNKGIMFADKSVQTTAFKGSGVADWLTMLNKPLSFTPAIHNHDALYKPITYEPASVTLAEAVTELGYLPIPERTTAEINALVVPKTVKALTYDKTLGVLKFWDGLKWNVVIMKQ